LFDQLQLGHLTFCLTITPQESYSILYRIIIGSDGECIVTTDRDGAALPEASQYPRTFQDDPDEDQQ